MNFPGSGSNLDFRTFLQRKCIDRLSPNLASQRETQRKSIRDHGKPVLLEYFYGFFGLNADVFDQVNGTSAHYRLALDRFAPVSPGVGVRFDYGGAAIVNQKDCFEVAEVRGSFYDQEFGGAEFAIDDALGDEDVSGEGEDLIDRPR